MEIQYAIFCEDISYEKALTLKAPISSLEVNILSAIKQLKERNAIIVTKYYV